MPDLKTCGHCDGEGHYDIRAGIIIYGSAPEDCEERFETVECEVCKGTGEVPAEASDGE